MTPLVSIITIVFNGDKHLQQTIDSVIHQTYPNIQYVIVDGGSTDRTLDIIRMNENKIFKWISEKDEGIADAFNKGIQMCSGEIIGLVNSDDWLESDAVELAVKNIGDADVVYGQVQFWINEKPAKLNKSDHTKLRLGMTVAHPASFVRRNVYEKWGGFKKRYRVAMDYDLFLRFLHRDVVFKGVPKVFSNMRSGGVSDNRWLLGIREEITIKDEYYSRVANAYYFLRQFAIFKIKKFLRAIKYFS
jgi:glycosyltransferase involved in cell wall biosynthesis